MVYEPRTNRLVHCANGYYHEFKDGNGAQFMRGSAGKFRIIQGQDGSKGATWKNDGGMTYITNGKKICRSSGACPFHPHEVSYSFR